MGCRYFDTVFEHPSELVDVISHELNNPIFGKIDFIVGTGLSGILPLLSVSIKTKIPFVVVRRRSDIASTIDNGGCHSGSYTEEGDRKNFYKQRYVIIDDCIDTGATIKYVMARLDRDKQASLAGIILYNQRHEMYALELQSVPVSIVWNQIKEVVSLAG